MRTTACSTEIGIVLVVAGVALTGCAAGSIAIVSPANGGFAAVDGTVTAQVSIGGGACGSSFQATLDGLDVTQQFSPQPPASATPQATFHISSSGDHLLKVRAQAGSSCTPVAAEAVFYHVGPSGIYITDGADATTHGDRVVRITDMTGANWTSAGTSGTGPRQFSFPRSLFVYSIERVYVADESNHRIALMDNFSATGSAGWTTFGTNGGGVNQFLDPIGIFLDVNMRIYVTDGWRNRIVRIDDMTGANWTEFGSTGSGVNEFNVPAGVLVDRLGRIYIVDSGNNRIVRMNDMTGAGWTTFGTTGSGPGQFNDPGMIAADASGRLYVTDAGNLRVVRIDDMTGAGWTSLGSAGAGNLQFGASNHLMGGIFVDTAGRIYVADSGNDRLIRMDDMTGAGWVTLGSYGTGIGKFAVPTNVFVKPPSMVIAP